MADNKILQAILDKVSNLESRGNSNHRELKEEIKKVHDRLDKIGLQLANLEDDAPTIEEFDNLEQRVVKLEKHQFTSA